MVIDMHAEGLAAQGAGRKRARRGAVRVAAIASLGLALSACAGSVKVEPNIATATVNMEVPLTKAFVAPPPGGPSVVAVLQDIVPNAVSQEIALSTLSLTRGQNAFYVTLFRRDAIDGDDLNDKELKPNAIRKEMLTRLAGVTMATSNFYVQNKYGPFGYAIGRSRAGDLCIYGWQRVVPNKPPSPFLTGPAGAISVRLRICDARASEAALLSLMYGYTINAYYMDIGWNPYGPPPEVSPSIGQISAPISPVGQEGLGSALNGETGPPALPSRPAVQRSTIRRSVPAAEAMDPPSVLPNAAPATPMRGYQQTAPASPYDAVAPGASSYGPAGNYAPQGTYTAPTARYPQPGQQMQVPPTPLSGYPVVPPPTGQ